MRTQNQDLANILAAKNLSDNGKKKSKKKQQRNLDPKTAAAFARGGAGRRNARQLPTRQLNRGR
ncbi:hypothetical protein [Actinomadura rudentiformis]|uniref:Uncharacterized protein n=1 Tax=Actinomadura rudentiformis TaxID=359158 RepID=A0A6H9YNF4_9ACTN|nr:hypothetical protein [Actinomadura rudentiformis]KAB2348504.1 hypothetical protein F8566_17125 [Actinomadura rudentiformis]